MQKLTTRDRLVLLLAFSHRYLYPIMVIIFAFSGGSAHAVPSIGAGLVLLAIHDLAAYRLRWRYFYCSLQNAHYRPMTPRKINWKQFKSTEIYGTAAVCGILGLALILFHFLFL